MQYQRIVPCRNKGDVSKPCLGYICLTYDSNNNLIGWHHVSKAEALGESLLEDQR